MEPERCGWSAGDRLYEQYHDTEWGVPVRDDDLAFFERLSLEGAQAGLSWITILRKRAHYRVVFDGFDPVRIAAYDEAKLHALMADPGIVRNRAKIASVVTNARAFLALQDRVGSVSAWLWRYVEGVTVQNRWPSLAAVPALTPASAAMSRDLKRAGFAFVGPTTCYALMQATGMVNDHITPCFRHGELGGSR
jgi:DNA-3-methyladenine glycosylase I